MADPQPLINISYTLPHFHHTHSLIFSTHPFNIYLSLSSLNKDNIIYPQLSPCLFLSSLSLPLNKFPTPYLSLSLPITSYAFSNLFFLYYQSSPLYSCLFSSASLIRNAMLDNTSMLSVKLSLHQLLSNHFFFSGQLLLGTKRKASKGFFNCIRNRRQN